MCKKYLPKSHSKPPPECPPLTQLCILLALRHDVKSQKNQNWCNKYTCSIHSSFMQRYNAYISCNTTQPLTGQFKMQVCYTESCQSSKPQSVGCGGLVCSRCSFIFSLVFFFWVGQHHLRHYFRLCEAPSGVTKCFANAVRLPHIGQQANFTELKSVL